MYRMKNGSVRMEFSAKTWRKGYTMRANINHKLIPALKRANQDDAAAIRDAIKRQDCKAVIYHMENAKLRNRKIRELSENHNKLVFDASGNIIRLSDHKEKCFYNLE